MALLLKTNLKAFARRFLRLPVRFGPEEKIEHMGIYRKLQSELGNEFFAIIGKLNEEMVNAELNWDGYEGLGQEGSAQYLRDEVIKLYSSFNPTPKHEHDPAAEHTISSSIGPFFNKESVLNEYNYSDYGSSLDIEVLRNRRDAVHTFAEESMGINLSGSGGSVVPVIFHIPPEKPITHNGKTYKVAYFGARRSAYWNQLEMDINTICETVKGQIRSLSFDAERKQKAIDRIEVIKGKVLAAQKILESKMKNFEEEQRKALGGSGGRGGLVGLHDSLVDWRNAVMAKRLNDQQIYYTHTYKVINVNDKGQLLDEYGNVRRDVHDNFISRQKNEVAPGLDEHGWPLEVGDGSTLFNGAVIPRGAVLLDFYEGHSPNGGGVRTVNPLYTRELDLLDVAVWVYVSYDSYRDDLRDGRYHKNAITLMEHIIHELEPDNIRRVQLWTNIVRGKHAKVKMKLNKLPGLRPDSDPDSVEMTIKPSHLNPAFDIRAKGKTRHIGRKYYYDLQENIFNSQSEEPTISTRGAALYILHRVIEETKYWGGPISQGKAGVMEVLEAIGEAINGYDIGANIGFTIEGGEPKLKSWGHPLTRNPFKPKR